MPIQGLTTPAYTLREPDDVIEALAWRRDPRQLAGPSVEDLLVKMFDAEATSFAATQDKMSRMFRSITPATKRYLVHHPYLAGHLRRDFCMSPLQLALYVAKQVAAYHQEQSISPVGQPADFNFSCHLSDDEYIPLLEDGREFTSRLEGKAVDHALTNLARATRDLSSIAPNAKYFVETFIWILALRAHPSESTHCPLGSRSFQCLPGLTLFCNPNSERVSGFALEEALIHEAIHSFLFFAESPNARLLADERDANLEVISPWTGMARDLHTGVHALFVWLSLAAYWSADAQTSGGAERIEYAQRRLDYIRAGFCSPGFRPFLNEVRARTTSEVLSITDALLDDYAAQWAG